jgi:Na+/melibiose symporter-like transporter
MNDAPPVPAVYPEPPVPAGEPPVLAVAPPVVPASKFYCEGWLVNLGWLNTTLALSVSALPFQYLLKEQLHLDPEAFAFFMLVVSIPTFVKPLAGILVDAVPLFGTRRRHYMIMTLLGAALLWIALGLVPRTFSSLLVTYLLLNVFLMFASTVLGGLMVEVGKREHQTGRLSAQRHGITQSMAMVGGLIGGKIARMPFLLPSALCALAYASAVPVFWLKLREPGGQKTDTGVLRDIATQARAIFRAGTLWSAAGLIVLVVAAPGFGTPLFYYQNDVLRFRPDFIGLLGVVGAGCAVVAAVLYSHFCRRLSLRTVLTGSIVLHGGLTLLYLFYHSWQSALLITAVEGATMSLALLPLYDLAARATPKASEALGYCVVISLWNFTGMFSNYAGAWLYTNWHLTFSHLVWLNAGTTLLVLVAVPFLPRSLTDSRDGDVPPTAD